jgi:hypothetical protein
MSEDWQPGNLALCVQAGKVENCPQGWTHLGNPGLVLGRIYQVDRVGIGQQFEKKWNCHCLTLGFTNRAAGLAARFRKINPLTDEQHRQALADLGEMVQERVL